MSQWVHSATLIKAKGTDGRFVARCAPDLPFMMPEGALAAFVPPQLDLPRNAVVRRCEPWDGDSYIVAFEGIDDRALAEALVGSRCLLRRKDLPQGVLDAAEGDLVGFEFWDGGMLLGTVAALRPNPGQPLLEVERCNGGPLLLVPFVEPIIQTVDREGRRVQAVLPAGLLDL